MLYTVCSLASLPGGRGCGPVWRFWHRLTGISSQKAAGGTSDVLGGVDHAGCYAHDVDNGVDGADLQETDPDDFPHCFHHLLEEGQYASDGTVIQVHHELLMEFSTLHFPRRGIVGPFQLRRWC